MKNHNNWEREGLTGQLSSLLFCRGRLQAGVLGQAGALGWNQDLHGRGHVWFISAFLLTMVSP